MSNNKEDDEDELEALRLAALESLRAKGLPPPVVMLPGQQQQRLSPKPNVCSNAVWTHFDNYKYVYHDPLLNAKCCFRNQVFQRHFGNQNLIAIIPVEHSSASSSPYQNSSPHHPPLLDSKATPPPVRSSVRPPLLKDPPSSSLLIHNNSVDEKPKASTKFSRFEDSDSDESDDIEMSFAKSESEEEEFVVEEGDAEDLIIEVEDEVVIEEFTEEVEEPTTSVTVPPDKMEVITSVAKKSEKYSTRLPQTSTPTPPLRTVEVAKEEPISRDFRNTDINRRLESGDFARRSPKSSSARSSPSHSRRRSSPIRQLRTSPRQRSPVRVQRSPPRAQRSPPRSQRSPTRSQRSPQRIQRSPPKTHRSPAMVPRSPARTQKSPPRSQRSPVRSSDRDKPKLKESGKNSSGSDRSGSDETKKIDRTRTSMDVNSSRPLDHRRVADKSRSPTSDRKPLLRRSPTRPNPSDREPRKLITPSSSDVERDRLESRKRKFETAPDLEPPIKKEGKIRLRESSHPTPPLQLRRKEEKPTRNESDHIEIRRDEPITMMHNKTDQDDSDKKMKKNKRSMKKSKEKSRNGKSHSGNEQDNGNFSF